MGSAYHDKHQPESIMLYKDGLTRTPIPQMVRDDDQSAKPLMGLLMFPWTTVFIVSKYLVSKSPEKRQTEQTLLTPVISLLPVVISTSSFLRWNKGLDRDDLGKGSIRGHSVKLFKASR